jgi:hypothetical protein
MIGFAHPLLLTGLIGVGLPVLIHMLTRPRPRAIPLPTVHLLVEAGGGQQALHRLRTWVVLVLRTLFVLFLVLIFAQPYWRARTPDLPLDDVRRVVFLVDASMSMRAASGGLSSFDRAKAQAADAVRALQPKTMAGVILIGAEPRPLLPVLSRNHAALYQALGRATCTHEFGDVTAAMAKAAAMLGDTTTGGEVIIFSDFQRANFADVDFASFQNVRCTLYPVTNTDGDNIGITAITRSPTEAVIGETVTLAAKLFNASGEPRRTTATLRLEGLTKRADVELRPYSSADMTLTFSLPAAGEFRGSIDLPGDALSDDNNRYFTLSVRQAMKALVVSDADPKDTRSSAYFLATAMSPSTEVNTGINVQRRRCIDVDRNLLETADVFVLAPPLRLTGETAAIIVRRLRDGAQLVCLLDGPGAPDLINTLAGASEGSITPPFALTRQVSLPRPVLHLAADRGPADSLELLRSEDADLGSLAFNRYYLTDNNSDRRREVLIRHGDGSCGLTVTRVGRGAVVYLNVPVTPDAGNIAGSPLFPVLIHDLLKALRRGSDADSVTPGMPWTFDMTGGNHDDMDYRVVGPDGIALNTSIVQRGRFDRLALSAAPIPGFYTVYAGDRAIDTAVVNAPPLETDTRALNLDGLVTSSSRVMLAHGGHGRVKSDDAHPMWPTALAMTALCLAVEMVVLALWRAAPKGSWS